MDFSFWSLKKLLNFLLIEYFILDRKMELRIKEVLGLMFDLLNTKYIKEIINLYLRYQMRFIKVFTVEREGYFLKIHNLLYRSKIILNITKWHL